MKKKYIIFILFLSLFASQKIFAQEAYLGVKGGVNIPFVNFTDFVIDTRGFRTGVFTAPYAAITYRYMHKPKIGIQMDIAYSGKGWLQYSRVENVNTNSLFTEINYIEVPVYLHWAIVGKRRLKFNIDLGAYAAYAVSASTTLENDQDLEQLFVRYNYETDNKGDFGLVMGASFSYDFTFGTIEVGGSFKTGFANILPVSHILKENPAISTNQVPSITLSYLLPLSNFKKDKKSNPEQKLAE